MFLDIPCELTYQHKGNEQPGLLCIPKILWKPGIFMLFFN